MNPQVPVFYGVSDSHRARRKASARAGLAAFAAFACGVCLFGCSLTKSTPKDAEAPFPVVAPGSFYQPKRCLLTILMPARPLNDTALNDIIWSVVDRQSIPNETRKALEINGLRAGIVAGALPPEIEEILAAPPPNLVQPYQIELIDGGLTPVMMTNKNPRVSLFLNDNGQAIGRDYDDAQGYFSISATQVGRERILLKIVPEIHHGPLERGWAAPQDAANPYFQQEFVMKTGQKEETFHDLMMNLALEPGQIAVVGCEPDRSKTLGSFLLTEQEPNGGRIKQKILLVKAARGVSADSDLAKKVSHLVSNATNGKPAESSTNGSKK